MHEVVEATSTSPDRVAVIPSFPEPVARNRKRMVLFLLLAPLALALAQARIPWFGASLERLFSLAEIPGRMHKHLEFLVCVPFGAVVVSFVRLTLGVSMFSLFRPILVALAFQAMGIRAGLLSLITALAAVALIRPLLDWAHYYARVPALVSFLVCLMIVPVLIGTHSHALWLSQLAYFPVIALCLTCESFASVLSGRGALEAVWLATTTTAVGILILTIQNIPGFKHALLRFPELLVAQAAVALLIGECFELRLFEGKNLFALALTRAGRESMRRLRVEEAA